MVQFLSLIFFLGFLKFLLGFSKVPVFCVTLYIMNISTVARCTLVTFARVCKSEKVVWRGGQTVGGWSPIDSSSAVMQC